MSGLMSPLFFSGVTIGQMGPLMDSDLLWMSFFQPHPRPLPEASAEDRTGFEVERDVEKDGKRTGKGWEKDGKRMKKDGNRVKNGDYLSIQYGYRAGFRQIG